MYIEGPNSIYKVCFGVNRPLVYDWRTYHMSSISFRCDSIFLQSNAIDFKYQVQGEGKDIPSVTNTIPFA